MGRPHTAALLAAEAHVMAPTHWQKMPRTYSEGCTGNTSPYLRLTAELTDHMSTTLAIVQKMSVEHSDSEMVNSHTA